MAKADLPSPELLRKLLRYDPETGLFTWRERAASIFQATAHSREQNAEKWNRRFAGKPALTSDMGRGYLGGSIFGKTVRANRVAWALSFGEWPQHEIDHLDADRGNNRLANLRDVSHAVNCKNKRKAKNNTSGHTGVLWRKDAKKWLAFIGTGDGRQKRIGLFICKDDAIRARQAAEAEFGYMEGHGIKPAWGSPNPAST